MVEKVKYLDLKKFSEKKKKGLIVQRDPQYFTLRTRMFGGVVTTEQLRRVADITDKYAKVKYKDGKNIVKLTLAQDFQIPWIDWKDADAISEEFTKIGIPPGSCGHSFRNVVACPGLPDCPYGNADVQKIADEIDKGFFGRPVPRKFKVSVTGCPNSCVIPQLKDFGVMAVVKPIINEEKCKGLGICEKACPDKAIKVLGKMAVIDYDLCTNCGICTRVCPIDAMDIEKSGFDIYVGGNVGRHPRFGRKILEFVDEKAIYATLEKILEFWNKERPVQGAERFGRFIEDIGIEEFKKGIGIE